MYYRVFPHCLDPDKIWYAYNYSLPGITASERHHKCPVYKWLSEEIKKVDIRDIRDKEGKPVSFRWFYAGVKKAVVEVYVVSPFAALVLALRLRTINDTWLQSKEFDKIQT